MVVAAPPACMMVDIFLPGCKYTQIIIQTMTVCVYVQVQQPPLVLVPAAPPDLLPIVVIIGRGGSSR